MLANIQVCVPFSRVRAELEETKQKVKNDNEDDVSPRVLW